VMSFDPNSPSVDDSFVDEFIARAERCYYCGECGEDCLKQGRAVGEPCPTCADAYGAGSPWVGELRELDDDDFERAERAYNDYWDSYDPGDSA
ncbi:MAG TPA: hypothetical protein PLV92_18455, partial [Pirellulaceae bacterium]|nr:hypothetical protein [Pirellulaceae bacterium]